MSTNNLISMEQTRSIDPPHADYAANVKIFPNTNSNNNTIHMDAAEQIELQDVVGLPSNGNNKHSNDDGRTRSSSVNGNRVAEGSPGASGAGSRIAITDLSTTPPRTASTRNSSERSLPLRSYSKWSPIEQGATLVWRDLCVYTTCEPNGSSGGGSLQKMKRIINNSTGAVQPGNLMALMGSRWVDMCIRLCNGTVCAC